MEGFESAIKSVFVLAIGFFVILPLAAWKVIDIVIWLFQHVRVLIGG